MAARFAVASGNWADTATWSATDGGASGASFPVAGDAVTIKQAVTVTVASGVPAAATSVTISTDNAATLNCNAALTLTGAMTLTQGVLDTDHDGSHPTHSWGSFSAGTSTKTITLGSSAITVTGTAVALSVSPTGTTITANTATITLSGAAAQANTGTQNWNGTSFVFSGSGTAIWGSIGATVANLTRTGTAANGDAFSAAGNITVTGTVTLTGNSQTNLLTVKSTTAGTARTITAAVAVLTNVQFQDITAAGASAPWVVPNGINLGGNSNIIFGTGLFVLSRGLIATAGMASRGRVL